MDRGGWWATVRGGHTESDATEHAAGAAQRGQVAAMCYKMKSLWLGPCKQCRAVTVTQEPIPRPHRPSWGPRVSALGFCALGGWRDSRDVSLVQFLPGARAFPRPGPAQRPPGVSPALGAPPHTSPGGAVSSRGRPSHGSALP